MVVYFASAMKKDFMVEKLDAKIGIWWINDFFHLMHPRHYTDYVRKQISLKMTLSKCLFANNRLVIAAAHLHFLFPLRVAKKVSTSDVAVYCISLESIFKGLLRTHYPHKDCSFIL